MQIEKKTNYLHFFILLFFSSLLWNLSPIDALSIKSWHLFVIFITTICASIFKITSILNASVLALAVTILSGTLSADSAYSGFSKEFILLIVIAFIIAKGVIKSGLGKRIAFHIIKKIGKSTLGIAYSTTFTDCLIAPAFPSNTARSGVLYPIIEGLALGNGSSPKDGTEKKIGQYLVMNAIAGISISSALWFTGMATNIVGAGIAKTFEINITFSSWVLNSCLPAFIVFLITPWYLIKIMKPEIKQSPKAPEIAKKELEKMGPMSLKEKIVALTFLFMVTCWSLSDTLNLNKTAIAFLGFGILMFFNILTLSDIKKEGSALTILIWFSILYTLSTQLSELGFMKYIGNSFAFSLTETHWITAYLILMLSYIVAHYFFVSQTAHMLAFFGVFLQVGITLGVPEHLLCYMLLFATNFFSPLTPQASSANIIFVGSEYLSTSELYKYGAIVTTVNSFIFLTFGSVWIYFIN